MGLVNAVIDAEALLAHAMRVARQLAALPPGALRASKNLLKRSQHTQVQDALHIEGAEFRARLAMPEAHEALRAFMEKRPADFSRF
jgi:enoyl-CoA hydratase/carnithine racemase